MYIFAHLTVYVGQIHRYGISGPKLVHLNFDPHFQTDLIESAFVWLVGFKSDYTSTNRARESYLTQTLAELERPLLRKTAGFSGCFKGRKGIRRSPRPAPGGVGAPQALLAGTELEEKHPGEGEKRSRDAPSQARECEGAPAALGGWGPAHAGRGPALGGPRGGAAGPSVPLQARPPAASPPALPTWRGGTHQALPRALGRPSGKDPGHPFPVPFPGRAGTAGWWGDPAVSPGPGPSFLLAALVRSLWQGLGTGPGRTGLGVKVRGGTGGAAEGPAWVRACECVCVSVCRSGSTLMHTPTRLHAGSAPSAGGNLRGACLELSKYPVPVPRNAGKVSPVSEAGCRVWEARGKEGAGPHKAEATVLGFSCPWPQKTEHRP